MMSFAKRFFLAVAIVITVTDLVMFYHLIGRTVSAGDFPFVVSVIAVTLLPIAVILWYWIPKYKLKW